MIQDAFEWHDDGHVIHLELNKASVVVTTVTCPDSGQCAHDESDCLVRWFIDRYELECNVGVCPAQPELRIAWTIQGSMRDLEAAQMWFVPVDDDMWQAWHTAQS